MTDGAERPRANFFVAGLAAISVVVSILAGAVATYFYLQVRPLETDLREAQDANTTLQAAFADYRELHRLREEIRTERILLLDTIEGRGRNLTDRQIRLSREAARSTCDTVADDQLCLSLNDNDPRADRELSQTWPSLSADAREGLTRELELVRAAQQQALTALITNAPVAQRPPCDPARDPVGCGGGPSWQPPDD